MSDKQAIKRDFIAMTIWAGLRGVKTNVDTRWHMIRDDIVCELYFRIADKIVGKAK
jgi:hypothetical protein